MNSQFIAHEAEEVFWVKIRDEFYYNKDGFRKFVVPSELNQELPFGVYEVAREIVYPSHREIYLLQSPLKAYSATSFYEATEVFGSNLPIPGIPFVGYESNGITVTTSPVKESRAILNGQGGIDYVLKTTNEHFYFGSYFGPKK